MKNLKKEYGVLSIAQIGLEFEFFSSLTHKQIISIFKKRLGVNIVAGLKERTYSKDKLGYHTGFIPTDRAFKLEKDFSGGPDMYELITGPMNYYEAKKVIIEALKTIKEIGWTTDKSSIHFNISFDSKEIRIFDIDPFKFCLGFKDIEDSIYKDFPSRRNNVYSESITRIAPDYNYKILNVSDISLDHINYTVPYSSRYFGVNFTKRKENYLEFRYIGGRNYEKKLEKILEYLDIFIYYTYNNAIDQQIDSVTMDKYLQKMQKKLAKVDGLKDYDLFKHRFPNIDIMVDLSSNPELIKIKFSELRDLLYDLIFINDMKEGVINYDSDVSRIQIKDATLKRLKDIDGFEFVNCDLGGLISNCGIYNCDINLATMNECIIVGNCIIENSKLYECKLSHATEIDNCFIKNTNFTIKGVIKNSVIASSEAMLDPNAEVDKESMFASPDHGIKKIK